MGNKTWAERIANDYSRCDKSSCEECLAYVTPYKRDKPICLRRIIDQCDETLKSKILKVLDNM